MSAVSAVLAGRTVIIMPHSFVTTLGNSSDYYQFCGESYLSFLTTPTTRASKGFRS